MEFLSALPRGSLLLTAKKQTLNTGTTEHEVDTGGFKTLRWKGIFS